MRMKITIRWWEFFCGASSFPNVTSKIKKKFMIGIWLNFVNCIDILFRDNFRWQRERIALRAFYVCGAYLGFCTSVTLKRVVSGACELKIKKYYIFKELKREKNRRWIKKKEEEKKEDEEEYTKTTHVSHIHR